MTVLLLEFYDTLRSRTEAKTSSGAHQFGAVALVKHRGALNFRSELSKRLLLAVRNRIIGSSVQRNQAISDDPAIWLDISPMPSSPAIQLDKLVFEFANLQASASTFDFPSTSTPPSRSPSTASFPASPATIDILQSILAAALHLDEQLAQWSRVVPFHWHASPVSHPSCMKPFVAADGLYGDYCDVYPSLHVASIWNQYRCTRLDLLKLILTCQRSLLTLQLWDDQFPSLQKYALDSVQRLVDEICASVPYHLGNRTGPGPIDSREGIEYPHFPEDEDEDLENMQHQFPPSCLGSSSLGNSRRLSRAEHTQLAASTGGWFILSAMKYILEKVVPGLKVVDMASRTDLQRSVLREGQTQWLLRQLQRTARIYRLKAQAPSTTPPRKGATAFGAFSSL